MIHQFREFGLTGSSGPALIAHVVYRFDVGGLENGLVNLLNRLSAARWRHAVVSLTEVTPAMRARVTRDDVEYIALNKGPGHLMPLYPRLYRLFRQMTPTIVHTRNLAALEATVPAWLAGVAARVHGEHGWDAHDIDGTNSRYCWVRRMYRPFVRRYVAVSRQIDRYLVERVGISRDAVVQIYNGVDNRRFHAPGGIAERGALPFVGEAPFVVGTVGRLQPVKNQLLLVRAFLRVLEGNEQARKRLRLVIVGDGPLRPELERELQDAGARDSVWLAGTRADIPELMRSFDLFVLPSLAEGVSNTILEAMSTGLPVIATRVGGNAELVEDGVTGALVDSQDLEGLAATIDRYFSNPALARQHGKAGRRKVEDRFSIDAMVAAYDAMYESLLRPRPVSGALAQGRN